MIARDLPMISSGDLNNLLELVRVLARQVIGLRVVVGDVVKFLPVLLDRRQRFRTNQPRRAPAVWCKRVGRRDSSTACCNARMAVQRRSHRSVPLIERTRALELRGTRASHPGPRRHRASTARAPRWSTQRAGIAPPHAESAGLSGVTDDDELSGVTSVLP